jgi:hypothetical protein
MAESRKRYFEISFLNMQARKAFVRTISNETAYQMPKMKKKSCSAETKILSKAEKMG